MFIDIEGETWMIYKKIVLVMLSVIVISLSCITKSYNHAKINNGASFSVVDAENALVSVPEGQVLGETYKVSVKNITNRTLKITIPQVTANEITVEGKDFIIPGNTQGECLVELTAPDGTDREIEVTVVAESLDDDFRAEIKASLIIRN